MRCAQLILFPILKRNAMNSENHHTHALSPLNDAIVFLVTVTVCTFLLTAASTFSANNCANSRHYPRAGYAESSGTACPGSETRADFTEG